MSDKRARLQIADGSTTAFTGSLHESDPMGFVLSRDCPPAFVGANTRYLIRDELGRGGGGIVYRAHDESLHRDVAIKILRHEYLDRKPIVERFIDEARVIGSLQHPGIPQIYQRGQSDDGRPFFSMKLVQGQNLRKLIEASHPIQCGEPIGVFAKVCQVVAYIHSQNIAHLDLKPENVMVGEFGEVHLMDWGHARSLVEQPRTPYSLRLHIGGTLSYMAPEHAAGQSVTKQFDVFALGATLCHLLTGAPPYCAESREQLHRQAVAADLGGALERLDQCGFDVNLIRLAKRCLAPQPHERPADAGEVAREMSAYFETALQRHVNDMRRFFDISCDLFCIAGFDGFFRRINVNFPSTLGHSEQELLARPFIDFVHPDDREQTRAQMEVLFDGKSVVRFRNRYRTAGGTYLELEWTAKPIPDERIIYAVARLV